MSLAEQIAALEDAAPQDDDPEDIYRDAVANSTQSGNAAREHYVTVQPSVLRKDRDDDVHPKYDGKSISRKELMDMSSDDDDDENESADASALDNDHDFKEIDDAGQAVETPSEGGSSNEEEEPPAERTLPTTPALNGLNEEPVASVQHNQDTAKGLAVSRQIQLWNVIVDARIRLQKAVVAANCLPNFDLLTTVSSTEAGAETLHKFLKESLDLSADIAALQNALITSNEELQPPAPKRPRLSAKPRGDEWKEQLTEATKQRNEVETSLQPYVLQTLHKWSVKVNAVSSSALLSSRNAFRPRASNQMKEATELIMEMLRDDKIIGRTRVLRNPGNPIESQGDRVAQEGQSCKAGVFDDTDFYHQLLRDVIEAKKDQNVDKLPLRPPKAKKQVDTRASKGRKIRYTVHEKLQNFMAPVPASKWHEEQIDELFASLLGKGSSGVEIIDGARDAEPILSDGFRVFG